METVATSLTFQTQGLKKILYPKKSSYIFRKKFILYLEMDADQV